MELCSGPLLSDLSVELDLSLFLGVRRHSQAYCMDVGRTGTGPESHVTPLSQGLSHGLPHLWFSPRVISWSMSACGECGDSSRLAERSPGRPTSSLRGLALWSLGTAPRLSCWLPHSSALYLDL